MLRSSFWLAAFLWVGCTTPASSPPAATDSAAVVPAESDAPTSAPAETTDWRAFFEGAWTGDDGEGSAPGLACPKALDVAFEGTQVICVVANQIWIQVRWALDEEAGTASLYLVGPDDVGAGGANLPWDEFSRDAPIATMEPDLGEGRFAFVTWQGFQMASGEAYGDDSGAWYGGSYTPTDGDTRIPTTASP